MFNSAGLQIQGALVPQVILGEIGVYYERCFLNLDQYEVK
jgi:hypothetical protein